MRKNLLLLTAACFTSLASFATVHTIHVAEFAFTPASMPGVQVGDTVKWIWDNGSHTTTSTTIPAGAAAWDQNLKSSAPTYSYVPTVPGTYNYKCDPHASMGMVASFTVTAPTGVQNVNAAALFSMYPNPVSSSLHLQFTAQNTETKVAVYNLAGQQVSNSVYTGHADIDMSGMANGVYMLQVQQGDRRNVQSFVVRH